MPFEIEEGAEPITGYKLIRQLGKGGSGEVWEAQAPGNFRVALKFISVEPGLAESELRSLDVIRGIRHPHLLDIHFAAKIDETLVIATSLCDRSLWDRFRECRKQGLAGLPLEELLGYMEEAAKALDYLNDGGHTTEKGTGGIQHRDVKPQNLFLVGGSLKVADFGLAKILEHAVTLHTGGMTPCYAAPEMIEGRISNRSDQYSLAITYCQLRTGKLPFEGTSVHEILYAHVHQAPNLSRLTIEPERKVVERALSRLPTERWPSCRMFVAELRRVLSTDANPAGGAPTILPPSPPVLSTQSFQNPAAKANVVHEATERMSPRIPEVAREPINLAIPRADDGFETRLERLADTPAPAFAAPMPEIPAAAAVPLPAAMPRQAARQAKPDVLLPETAPKGGRLKTFTAAAVALVIVAGVIAWTMRSAGALTPLATAKKDGSGVSTSIASKAPGAGDEAHKPATEAGPTLPFEGKAPGAERNDNLLGMRFCWCPPGSFTMGSPANEALRDRDENQVAVRITRGFWMGKHEVTQTEYAALMETNPSAFARSGRRKDDILGLDDKRLPVESVSWEDAMLFCRRLTEKERAAGRLPVNEEYSLPTEAQWEFACRAGSSSASAFGSMLTSKEANFDGTQAYSKANAGPSLGRPQTVGSYAPNAWGLCDMHGNVWEWCRDWQGNVLHAGDDPELTASADRAIRGGGFSNAAWYCRSANRSGVSPATSFDYLGFRVCRTRARP